MPTMSAHAAAAAAAAAADSGNSEEVPDDRVVGTINMLIADGKIKNVVEDPRNVFIRGASTPAASVVAKWMAKKMTGKQAGASSTRFVLGSSSQSFALSVVCCAGGNEVLKRYFQFNQAHGRQPGPTALGSCGLAGSWKFTKPGDPAEYFLYGPKELQSIQLVAKPPATTEAFAPISQATGYVTLYENDFFAGKKLSRLIRRGDVSASTKGNVAHILIEKNSGADDGSADANADAGSNDGAPFSVGKGAKVQQTGSGVPITGKLRRAVVQGATDIWVELQDCDDLDGGASLNGGGVGTKNRFKKSTKTQDKTVVIGNADHQFEAKVTDITVYCAVVGDDTIDPRLSPVMCVPAECNPFLACGDELRNGIQFLSCLKAAKSVTTGSPDGDTDVSLTVALPKGKLAVTAPGFKLVPSHFKKAKFPNLQCDIPIFKDVSIDVVKDKIVSAYDSCFGLNAPPIVATKEMQAKDPPEKGAGEIARDALCDINPVVRTVLSLAPSETIKTAPKRKKYEQALGLIGKPVKKRKSGTGKEKAVDEIPYYVLYYFAQDVLMHADFSAAKLRMILRRVCHTYCEETNQTLKVTHTLDTSDDVDRLNLGLQMALFKRPISDHVCLQSFTAFEASEERYTYVELGM